MSQGARGQLMGEMTMAPGKPLRSGGGADLGRMGITKRVTNDTPADTALPVVGWLVAVNGPCRGRDLRIVEGTNTIGRGLTNDICITWDATISREKNSAITYNSDERKFYITHLYGHGATRLNGRDVSGGDRELANYAKVTIGNSAFLFVALCGPHFNWGGGPGMAYG